MPDPNDVRTGTFIRGEHLVELDITENSIDQISAWVKLFSSISRFYGSENRINLLSSSMGENVFIRELDLNRCMLYKIPSELGHCTLLVKLYLENNQLCSIPEELSNLSQLEELRSSHNLLSELPACLFEKMLALKVLTVENNLLSELPQTAYTLPQLIFFDASFNTIKSLPEEVCQLVSIRIFLFGDNEIATVPDSIGDCMSLEVLELHNNCLTSLPLTMSNLRSLRRLSVYGNLLGPKKPPVIAEITLPPNINMSKNNMNSLYLDANLIDYFSSNCTEVGLIKLYLNAVWEAYRAVHTAPNSVAISSIPQTIGNICSMCDHISAAYFTDTEENLGEDFSGYSDKMKDVVCSIDPPQTNLSFSVFVGIGSKGGQRQHMCHEIKLNNIDFPENHTPLYFAHSRIAFERFSCAAKSLYTICKQYSDEYSAWKLKLREPDPIPIKKVSVSKIVSPKGKPKQVSFRRHLSAKSNGSSKSLKVEESMEKETEIAENQVPESLENNGDRASLGADSSFISDSEADNPVQSAIDNESILPTYAISVDTSPSFLAEKKELTADVAAKIENSMFSVRSPPQSDRLPLVSELVLRNMFEQRQHPLNQIDDKESKVFHFGKKFDPVVCLLGLMECYSGLGTALVGIAEFVSCLLRIIESRGQVNPSCLSLCQRLYDDFDDLLGEKAAGFAKKKFKAPGSETKSSKKEDILAQVESMVTKKKNGESVIEDASKDVPSVEQPNNMIDVPLVEEPKDSSDTARSDRYSMLDTEEAKTTVEDLERNRRRILLLAIVYLDRAAFIEKLCGWDAKSMKMQNSAADPKRAVLHFGAKTYIESVVHVGFYFGKALQQLRNCSTAVMEYSSVLSIGPTVVWHPLQLEILKCYLDVGEFLKAEELLFKILDSAPSLHLRSDKSKELGELNTPDSNLSREVRMLAAIISSGLDSLRSAGVGAKEQLNRFELETSGVLVRRSNEAKELEVGLTDRLIKKVSDIKLKEKLVFAEEKVEYMRAETLRLVEESKERAVAVMKLHTDFVEEMGPIVMPE